MEPPGDEYLLKDRKVLVTGANGFIGRHLVRALTGQKAWVSVIDMSQVQGPDGTDVTTYTGNLEDGEFIDECVERCSPDIIFHLAAFKERSSDIASFYRAVRVNILGSLNLFAALGRCKSVSSVVVLGTAEEYGRNESPFTEEMRGKPVTAYSYSKLCLTNLCEILYSLYRLPVVVLRPTLAYGPGQGTDMFMPSLIRSLVEERSFVMTPGEQTRDFLYITDLVDALIKTSVAQGVQGEIINIGSGTPVRLLDLVAMVEGMLDKKGLVRIGGRDYRPDEIMDYHVDTSKVKRLIGWEPRISLEEGIKLTIESFLSRDVT